MEGDSNDVLEDLDKKIMEKDLRRVEDKSIGIGLTGISYYIQPRLNSTCSNDGNLPFDPTYLSDWNSINSSIVIPTDKHILQVIFPEELDSNEVMNWSMGLNKGCVGYGLKIISI